MQTIDSHQKEEVNIRCIAAASGGIFDTGDDVVEKLLFRLMCHPFVVSVHGRSIFSPNFDPSSSNSNREPFEPLYPHYGFGKGLEIEDEQRLLDSPNHVMRPWVRIPVTTDVVKEVDWLHK